MPISNGVLQLIYEQHHRPGMYLGRHMELDARSLNYPTQVVTDIQPKEWPPAVTTLSQGSLGSCTGNAGTYHLSNLYANNLSSLKLTQGDQTFRLTPDDMLNNEKFAVTLYSLASEQDIIPANYPPTDTGSTGLAVCKATLLQQQISGYTWATSVPQLASMLQAAGCIVGVPWYNAWFEPDARGFIDSGDWLTSGIAGGHEIYFEALESWDASDLSQSVARFHNSWGNTWGDSGCGRMHLSTYAAIIHQADAKQFHLAA